MKESKYGFIEKKVIRLVNVDPPRRSESCAQQIRLWKESLK